MVDMDAEYTLDKSKTLERSACLFYGSVLSDASGLKIPSTHHRKFEFSLGTHDFFNKKNLENKIVTGEFGSC